MIMEEIVKDVCYCFDLTPTQLHFKVRGYAISHPRQLAMYIMRKKARKPFTEIATYFGVDHTSVIHAKKAVEKRLLNKEYREKTNDLLKLYDMKCLEPKITITFFPFSMKVRQNVSRL